MEDGLGETRAVPVALGEGVHALVENAFQKAQAGHLGHGGVDLRPPHASKFGGKSQEAIDGHVRIARSAFGQIAD